MSTYNNVRMPKLCVLVKRENMVWGWGWVSAAWVGVPWKVRETSGNFTWPGEWSPCMLSQ